MIYDKNSFLSGIAVGRQLKGWAMGQGKGGGGTGGDTQSVSGVQVLLSGVSTLRAAIASRAEALAGTQAVIGAVMYLGDSLKDLGSITIATLRNAVGGALSMQAVSVVTYGAWDANLGAVRRRDTMELDECTVSAVSMEVDRDG